MTRTGRELTGEQIQFFDENGYLLLRNWIPAPLLDKLREASDLWRQVAWTAGAAHAHPQDFRFGRPGGRKSLFKINYLHDKGHPASLELLGSPALLAVAESLCGPDFVPTFEAMVVKQEGGGANVPWHQDAVHPRTHRIFNYGLYLDQSLSGEGALRVIPGTHTAVQDICGRASAYGWDAPGAVTLEVEPGDVLLHDVMLVHGSPQVTVNRLRRTIYVEFRAAQQILDEGPWDDELIDRRLRLVRLGLDRHAAAFPEVEQFQWRASKQFRPEPLEDEEPELRAALSVGTPGTYCSAGNAVGRAARTADVRG